MSSAASATRDLVAALAAAGESVACAESLTGGELAALLSAAPGSSAVFRGGVVAYATEVKRSVLGVSAERVVSARCAEQLAQGVRDLVGADWAIGTTGVAGPDRQEEQPVGTVFVAVAGRHGVRSLALLLSGDRAEIRRSTCEEAVLALLEQVRADG